MIKKILLLICLHKPFTNCEKLAISALKNGKMLKMLAQFKTVRPFNNLENLNQLKKINKNI